MFMSLRNGEFAAIEALFVERFE